MLPSNATAITNAVNNIMRKEKYRAPGINIFSLPGLNVPVFFFLQKTWIAVIDKATIPVQIQIAGSKVISPFLLSNISQSIIET